MYKSQSVSLTQGKSRTLAKQDEIKLTPCNANAEQLESYYTDTLDMYAGISCSTLVSAMDNNSN